MIKVDKLVDDYTSQNTWLTKENANSNYSFSGLQCHIASEVLKKWALNNMYKGQISNAHFDAFIHIHDLGSPTIAYCAGWSVKTIVDNGFKCNSNFVSSDPPSHLSSLLGQMVNFIFTMSGEWAGAQAFNSVDTYCASFIKYENLTREQIYRELRQFVFSLNVKTRIAMQSPFSNISIDLTCPNDLKYSNCIIGGKEVDFTYGDCQAEMNLFNEVLVDVMTSGDADHKPFTFPIITYGITDQFDFESEFAGKIFKFADECNSPYFSNFISSDMSPESIRSMCCRLRLDVRELIRNSSGLFGSGDSTGSLGVVTLNLSLIGYVTKLMLDNDTESDDYKKLMEILSNYSELQVRIQVLLKNNIDYAEKRNNLLKLFIYYFMDLARVSLLIKRKEVLNSLDKGLIPYTKKYLGHLDNHFNTIGVNSAHEMCLNLLGEGIETASGKELSEWVLGIILERLSEYQEMDKGLLFNLESSPAEGAGTRFAKADRKKFKNIITGAGTNQEFYTNSTMLPDNYSDDIFEVCEHQDKLQSMYTSGTVLHIYMNEPTHNYKAIKSLVKKIFTNYKIPYISISADVCICPIHGKLDKTYEYCPYDHTEEQLAKFNLI
jgi:anaerobic ribonucleoside-triphosphate reductase